ncbi:MAG: heavy-metal-associated domain-containing protein [Microcoleaceae cyanobacterium]
MTLHLKVPSMVCDGCVDTVKEAIQGLDSGSTVEIDLQTKQVTVEGTSSEDEVKQAITAVGHTVES